ncbi:MAG: SDR family NAD(P)-dependent oxidoreductase [Mediterranea massiliensis]|nr:SDR family NAD(P)-dependent oxidoreductase [Mediterranea massiliensis]
MKRAIIIGATSGIGREVARLLVADGWQVGVAGRREEALKAFEQQAPDQIAIQYMDVTSDASVEQLRLLIDKVGGMDLFFLSSGIGFQNAALDVDIELRTMQTNGDGFMRMVTAAYHYFKESKRAGHIAVISSIAGTRGIGVAPAYSATKCFQNCYIQALTQLARLEHLPIHFTDIRPGFVTTALIANGNYPMQMTVEKTARLIMKALKRKKRVAIIDWKYRLLVFMWRLIPRFVWERLPVKS